MSKMVDSNQKKLNISEIILIALENTKSKYPPKVAYPAIVTEMSQKNTDVKQIGNTIFVLHRADKDQAAFKALNADIASNFVEKFYKIYVHIAADTNVAVSMTEGAAKTSATATSYLRICSGVMGLSHLPICAV